MLADECPACRFPLNWCGECGCACGCQCWDDRYLEQYLEEKSSQDRTLWPDEWGQRLPVRRRIDTLTVQEAYL